MPENELQLVLEAVSGNCDSFGRLADRYSPVLLGLAYTLTGDMDAAADIAQEALLKAYASLATLRRPDRFGSWLRQIAANLARTHLRSQGRRPQVPLDEMQEAGGETMDEAVERRLARQEVLRTLQSVPEGPRAAVVLHYVVGLTPAEAARHLGISRAAFDTRLSRGREALRRELTLLMDEALTEAKAGVELYLSGISERVRASLTAEQRERVTAAKELALLAARANLPRLFRDLKTHDESTRKTTAQLLGETLDHRAIGPLAEALSAEENPGAQAEICRSLARLGATAAIPALHALSRNTADMTVHKAAADAVKALQELGAPEEPGDIPVEIDDLKAGGIEALFLDLLKDEGAAVRVHAADGLGRVESVKALAALTQVLEADPQAYVRRAAAEALGAILWSGRTSRERVTTAQRERAVRALAPALADGDMAVQAEAAWSLSLITPDSLKAEVMSRFHEVLAAAVAGRPGPWWVTFPALAGALGGTEDQVRIVRLILQPSIRFKGPLVEAVVQLARPGQTEANALILEALRTNADPKCDFKLVKALGISQDPAVLPTLQDSLRSPKPQVREEAAKAIAGYENGQELLKEAITTGDEPLILSAAAAVDDPTFLEANAERLSPKGRITLQAMAKRLTRAQ